MRLSPCNTVEEAALLPDAGSVPVLAPAHEAGWAGVGGRQCGPLRPTGAPPQEALGAPRVPLRTARVLVHSVLCAQGRAHAPQAWTGRSLWPTWGQ